MLSVPSDQASEILGSSAEFITESAEISDIVVVKLPPNS